MSEQLKPCPFCGGDAYSYAETKSCWCVGCRTCNAEVVEPGDMNAAISAWNRRSFLAATTSEDGGEVPVADPRFRPAALIVQDVCEMDEPKDDPQVVRVHVDDLLRIADRHIDDLVAQHSRIVAAKDWEISTITAWWRAANVRALELEEKVSKKDAEIARLKADDAEAIKRPPYAHICIGMPAALHHDTRKLLERFTHALAVKLRAAEEKYGYSNGWKDADWMDECRAKLAEHMAKGDPRDVAAYCAFLWHHGESTAQPARQVGEYGDAYQGAREDLAIWKRRALEAEESVRRKDQIIDHLTLEAQGETRMGEPVIPNARQVGGDEREQFIAWAVKSFPDAYTREAAEHYWDKDHVSALAWQARAALAPVASQVGGDERCPTCDGTGDVHGLDGEWKGECHCAALAPAAVAVVMPEPLHVPNVHGYSRAFGEGYNECLEEVYRLNRRAIPEGLLERICNSMTLRALDNAVGELRTLLGKDGER